MTVYPKTCEGFHHQGMGRHRREQERDMEAVIFPWRLIRQLKLYAASLASFTVQVMNCKGTDLVEDKLAKSYTMISVLVHA